MRSTSCLSLLLALAACGGARAPHAAPLQPAARAATRPTAQAAPLSVDPLSAAALLRDVAYLAGPELHGRGSATDDEARAAAWLEAQTIAIGLSPLEAVRIQPFLVNGRPSRNVIGVLEPPSRIDDAVIVVGAHYDHDGVRGSETYWGADDNASGVAAILGVARTFAKRPERVGRRIVFVFFGAEELGLLGSFAFVKSGLLAPQHIRAMVNVDMLGRPLQDQPAFRFAEKLVGIDAERSIGVAGVEDQPWFKAIVDEACAAEGHRAVGVEDLPEIVQPAAQRASTGRSDHYPFANAGVPAMIFSSGESVDYHRPTDRPETLRPDLLATRARIVLRTVEALSKLPALPATGMGARPGVHAAVRELRSEVHGDGEGGDRALLVVAGEGVDHGDPHGGDEGHIAARREQHLGR